VLRVRYTFSLTELGSEKMIVPKKYYVLVNNPCAPHYKVTINGEFSDCTGPEQSPANMPIPKGDLPFLFE